MDYTIITWDKFKIKYMDGTNYIGLSNCPFGGFEAVVFLADGTQERAILPDSEARKYFPNMFPESVKEAS